jgi:dipeptidyl aminopeptidase/acylaminoacyl peptidase
MRPWKSGMPGEWRPVRFKMRLPYLLIIWTLFSCPTAVANDPSQKAAFVKGNEIYRADAAGHIRQLTSDGIPKWLPAWSEDGQKLAFMRKAPRTESLGHLVVITDSGEAVIEIPLEPVEPNVDKAMRFVETLQWIAPDRIAVGGTVNPSTIEVVVLDIATGKQTDETDSDEMAPTFSTDGKHFAGFFGSPHFADEEGKEPELDVDNKRVYPPETIKVDFLTKPVWSPETSDVAVVAKDKKAKTYSVVLWRNDEPLVTLPVPVPWEDVKADLFWKDNALILHVRPCTWHPVNATTIAPDCKTIGRAWKVADDLKTLVEVSPESATKPAAKESVDEESMLSLVKQAGGSSADVWCKSCALATRPRKASVDGQ